MAKFYQGTHLSARLETLVNKADDFLYIVSPYIKIHRRFRDELDKKKDFPKLEIVILFGKNEEDLSKSMKTEEVEYLKSFPNIIIAHDKDLHAKYYASEDSAMITSLNLHEFSQNNNIEAGISLLPDEEAYTESLNYFRGIIKKADTLYERRPKFDNGKYVTSTVVKNEIDKIFGIRSSRYEQPARRADYREQPKRGYCIRTGVEIPFNPEKPMTYDAYQTWAQFGNPDYPENFCHRTGKPSYGKTSMRRPIL